MAHCCDDYARSLTSSSTTTQESTTISAMERPRYCVDASRGLAYLEKMGCIHRDVAARNFLIGDGGEVVDELVDEQSDQNHRLRHVSRDVNAGEH